MSQKDLENTLSPIVVGIARSICEEGAEVPVLTVAPLELILDLLTDMKAEIVVEPYAGTISAKSYRWCIKVHTV